MICKDCPHFKWFGDLVLHYCDLTIKIVGKNDECHILDMLKERKQDDSN